jgi:hypothetical protein
MGHLVKLPSLHDADGRRVWSFIAIWIGCIVFTVFAAVGVWLVSSNAYYSLILALAAHVQLLVGMGAFSFVLGRRMRLKGGRDGIEFDDSSHVPTVTTTTKTEISNPESPKE